jgi:hypothetical protein
MSSVSDRRAASRADVLANCFSMSSVWDRRAASRADVLANCSDREVDGCLNSQFNLGLFRHARDERRHDLVDPFLVAFPTVTSFRAEHQMFHRPAKFADDGVITPIPPNLDLSPSYSALERPIATSSTFDGNRFDRHVKDDCPDSMPSLVIGGDDMWRMIAHIISYWGFFAYPHGVPVRHFHFGLPDDLNEFRRPTLTSLSLLDRQGSGKSRRNNALQAFP